MQGILIATKNLDGFQRARFKVVISLFNILIILCDITACFKERNVNRRCRRNPGVSLTLFARDTPSRTHEHRLTDYWVLQLTHTFCPWLVYVCCKTSRPFW